MWRFLCSCIVHCLAAIDRLLAAIWGEENAPAAREPLDYPHTFQDWLVVFFVIFIALAFVWWARAHGILRPN